MKKYQSVFKEEFNPKKLDSLNTYIVSFITKCIDTALKGNKISNHDPYRYAGTGSVISVKGVTSADLEFDFAIGWGLDKNEIWFNIASGYVQWNKTVSEEKTFAEGNATVENISNWIRKNIAS